MIMRCALLALLARKNLRISSPVSHSLRLGTTIVMSNVHNGKTKHYGKGDCKSNSEYLH
jgi:hypothetical protein